ncbi:MAG: hypothetical protein QXH42_01755 [Thermoplasmata archaeon]
MNYVNSIGLKAYHSVFNITVQLVLVKLLYPKRVQETWMGGGLRSSCSLLLASLRGRGGMCFPLFPPYRLPAPNYVPFLLADLLLIDLSCVVAGFSI